MKKILIIDEIAMMRFPEKLQQTLMSIRDHNEQVMLMHTNRKEEKIANIDKNNEETDEDEDNIAIVMQQATCSRDIAIQALKKHKNIVDAILEVTP